MTTADEFIADHREFGSRHERGARIRRYTGAGAGRPRHDTPVTVRLVDYAAREMVSPTILQGDRKAIVLTQDLLDAQFALPVRPTTDKLVVRRNGVDVELNIQAVDDNTRRYDGILVAYELQVRG